ncbi:MAG: transposase [Nostoc sp. DedQUE11]|nr:transposase [Nostoc sp. DedQUE11]
MPIIDLLPGYKNLVIELIPQTQVIEDRFQVMTKIHLEPDKQRKREKSQTEYC